MTTYLRPKIADKWLFSSVFIWLVTTGTIHAQEFTLGLKGGLLISRSFYGDKDDGKAFESQITPGFYAAGIIGFPLKKNYACILEGGISRHGREIIFSNGYGRNKATYNFADAVLLLRKSFRFNLAPNLPTDVYFNIGPHINYWISGKGTIGTTDNDGSPYTVVFEQDVDLGQFDKMYLNNINRWLFGLDIGVGMQAPITPKQHIAFELRFTSGHTFYGQRNSASYSWVEFEDNLRANEKVLTLSVAYTFDFSIQQLRTGKSTKDKEVRRKPVKKNRRPRPKSSAIKL